MDFWDFLLLLIGLLGFIWVIVLPFAFFVVLYKYRRTKDELLELYTKGEISKTHYVRCAGSPPPFANDRERERIVQASLLQNQSSPEPVVTEAPTGEIAPEPVVTEAPASEIAPEPVVSETPASEIAPESEVSEAPASEIAPESEVTDAPASEIAPEPVVSEAPASEIAPEPEVTEASASEIAPEPEVTEAPASEIAPEPVVTEAPASEIDSEPQGFAARSALNNDAPAGETPKDEAPKGSLFTQIPFILGLGVALICIAGAAYISSFWNQSSEFVKLTAVGSFGLIFYGAFRIAHNKLQIINSAKAFYILFVAALGITVTAAELFGLILPGASPAVMMLLPSAVIAAGMFRGYTIFKANLFPILGICFVFLFLTALSCAVFDENAMMFFIPAVVSTGALAFVTLSKKESVLQFRKPALVMFIVFTSLLMVCTFAIADTFNGYLMTAFALSLVILMHIRLYDEFSGFSLGAIPVALCWAALSFINITSLSRPTAFLICSVLLSASIIASYICSHKHGRMLHSGSVILYVLTLIIIAVAVQIYKNVWCGYALFIPTLTFIIIGAHLVKEVRAISAHAPEIDETAKPLEETDDGKSLSPAAWNLKPYISAGIALCAGLGSALWGYLIIRDSLASPTLWHLNLGMSLALCAAALVPEQLRAGDIRSRRSVSFALLILFALMQLETSCYTCESDILNDYPLNQLIFLVPAFAFTIFERADALRSGRRSLGIAAYLGTVVVALWIVPLLMLLLNVALSHYTVLGMRVDLSNYIIPVDALLLAGILLYEPKAPLCPNLGEFRLCTAALLIGLSYAAVSFAHDQFLTDDLTIVQWIPWITAALYLAIILFYTFRKKIALAEAPHLRLRGAAALLTLMSLMQLGLNDRITAVLLIPALALMVLDDRRCAKLNDAEGRTHVAIIESVLFLGLIALLVLRAGTIFHVSSGAQNFIQEYALAAVALLLSFFVLAEHLLMRKCKTRPYRLVVAVDLELVSACALIYLMEQKVLFDPLNNWFSHPMLLLAGLIGSWCMSHREHCKYGLFSALSVFVGIYAAAEWAMHLWHLYAEPHYFVWIATAVLTAAIAFFDGFRHKGYTHLRAVWALAAIPLIVVDYDPYHIAHTAGVFILALNLLQYLRDRGQSDHDRTLITIASSLVGIALSLKIFVLPRNVWIPDIIRPELIGLIPLATAYLVSWLVWKFRAPSHGISSTAALIILPLIYIIPSQNVGFHAVTVTILAIASIVVAIRTKLNRYLAIGIVSIAIIFFSQTRSFWFSLHWWVYLAVVGAILLIIAVINETERHRGTTLLQRAKSLMARAWKW